MVEANELVMQSDALRSQGDIQWAEAGYRTAIETIGKDSAPIMLLFNAAAVFAEMGQVKDADGAYNAALLKLPPDEGELSAEIHTKRAKLAAKRGDQRASAVHFGNACEAKPNDPVLLYSLGSALEASRNPAAAVEQFQAAIALDGTTPSYHTALAIALKQLGKPRTAWESALNAAVACKGSTRENFELGSTLRETFPDAALRLLRKAFRQPDGQMQLHSAC